MSCGCQKVITVTADEGTTVSGLILKSIDAEESCCRTIDIFTFEDEGLRILDSYQRIEGQTDGTLPVASRNGKKKMFVCANGQWGKEDWLNVNSPEALGGFRADLEKEMRDYPIMTGETGLTAGKVQQDTLTLRRLTSDISVRTVRADFSGKGYYGAPITDVKIYLINVNACCSIRAEDRIMPERIINYGRLYDADVINMKDPSLIFREIDEDIDEHGIEPGITLRTFPNTSEEESPGSPFTRLVIEGKILDETYYWTIDIGRDGREEVPGIRRNCAYVYDILICGKGSRDPDIATVYDCIDFKSEIMEWERKEERRIVF